MKKKEQQDDLSSFMKNHFNAKSNKVQQDKPQIKEEETQEEKELKEAKKRSRGRALEANQFEMYKKLIKELLIKYGFGLLFLVILSISIVELTPVILDFIRSLLAKLILSK